MYLYLLLSGIGAPFLYLWCMAGVTHSQLMAKVDEVNRRMDGQDETLKSIQSSLVELTSAVKALDTTQYKSKVKGYESDAPHNIDVEESDGQLHEDGESSSATKGKNGYITQLSKTEYEEKRMKNECLYCRQKYTQGHKCRLSKLLMLICPDAEDGKIDNGDSTIMEESDNGDKMSKFTPNPKPDEDIQLKEGSLFPPVNDFASGVENMKQMPTSNPFVVGVSHGWREQTNVGHRSDLKREAKVVFDESFGSASSNQKDDSSLTGECSSVKISSLTPKPDSNPHQQQGFPLPPIKTPSYGKGNLKPIPDSNYMYPIPSKSQQPMESHADKENQIADCSDSHNNRKMSGHPRNRSAGGKPDGRRKQTNAGSPTQWKPKIKVASDESSGSASVDDKDDSSLTGECISENMASIIPKPDLNPHPQEKSPLPPVKHASPGRWNFQSTPDSSHSTDNVSEQPKSVSTSNSDSKDSNHLHPVLSKSQQGIESQDGIAEKGKQIGDNGGKPEDGDHSRFDICPKKVNTGGVKLKKSLLETNREKRNQMKLSVEGPNIKILRPGMVIIKGYISSDDQVKIVKTCRELGIGDGGFYQPRYNNGAKLHLKMMCLGRNWDPQSRQYVDTRPIDNSKPPKIPDYFHDMVKRAIQVSNLHIQKNKGKTIPSMLPDICIVNFYTKDGKLGLHQDKDESRESLNRGLPVVSFSIGANAEFLYGDERDIEKAEKVKLESGDVLIFGGESRHIFHGVPSIDPDSASKSLLEATDMLPGRLNIIFKQF